MSARSAKKQAKRTTKKPPKKHSPPDPPRGSLPTRRQAEEDDNALFELVDFLRSKNRLRPLTWRQLGYAIGKDGSTAQRLLHPKNRSHRKLTAEQRKWITDYIDELRLLFGTWLDELRPIPHSLFYAMMLFFDINDTSINNTRALIEGTYKFWRYSTRDKDKIVYGRWDIVADGAKLGEDQEKKELSIQVKVRQIRKSRPGLRSGEENLDGYLFRIANHYIALIRENQNNNPRCIFFKRATDQVLGNDKNPNSIYSPNTKHITELDGFAIGLDGDDLFFSPHHMQLVDDKDELAALDSNLDIVPNVPEEIKKRLKRYPRVVWSEPWET